MTVIDPRIANLDESAALPRKNGELVFKAPWEGRAFGMAVVLNERGTYPWSAFRAQLVEKIAAGSPEYYESWLAAFESLLIETGVVSAEELERRAAEYRALERDPVF
jgi:nitrile hydratase accessory protein